MADAADARAALGDAFDAGEPLAEASIRVSSAGWKWTLPVARVPRAFCSLGVGEPRRVHSASGPLVAGLFGVRALGDSISALAWIRCVFGDASVAACDAGGTDDSALAEDSRPSAGAGSPADVGA